MNQAILTMDGIGKTFPGVKALDGVHLELRAGEVHALMGENGAGKSTLMKVLGGVHQATAGKMTLNGQTYTPASPLQAQAAGIGFVHQELKLAEHMTVAENIYLGRLPTKGLGVIDKPRLTRQAQNALSNLGVELCPNSVVGDLNVAMRQMVELAKALSLNSQVLIMDEPTASLSARETEHLFTIIESLKEAGKTVVYISHRMEEVFRLSDRITILRDGKSVGTWSAQELDEDTLVRHMVGREVGDQFPPRDVQVGPEILRVEGLSQKGKFEHISFTLRAGEIVGMGGLVGAGRTEIARAIAGIDPYESGSLRLFDRELQFRTIRDGIQAGIGYITEDRKGEGLALGLSIENNVTLASLKEISAGLMVKRSFSHQMTTRWIEKLRVRTPSKGQLAKNLSGGNQQKVVIAKWLARKCKVLIFDEPTRGVDVGARAEIYRIIEELAAEGVGILVISSDLPELIGLSDRILMVHQGRIAGEFSRQEATPESVIACAFTGAKV